jgi:hypothetical protein
MNRIAAFAAAALVALTAPALAQPAAPAAAATGKTFSVQTSTIGELLDNPAAKAIFVKYLPDVVSNPQIDMGRGLTLPDIVQYDASITPDKLAAIDADLKALPPQ